MKSVALLLSLIVMLSQAKAAYTSTEIVFKAPTVPNIDKPACAKVEILKKVTVPAAPSSGLVESFQFTYMITLERGCQGTLTLTSTFESNPDHRTQTIKKSYPIKDGALIEPK